MYAIRRSIYTRSAQIPQSCAQHDSFVQVKHDLLAGQSVERRIHRPGRGAFHPL